MLNFQNMSSYESQLKSQMLTPLAILLVNFTFKTFTFQEVIELPLSSPFLPPNTVFELIALSLVGKCSELGS